MLYKGSIISAASGKMNGLVFSHNAGGQYIRALVIPTDPSSAGQIQVRNAMSVLTSAWVETLTAAQRDSWSVYGENVPLVGPLGDSRNIGGLSQYVRSNISRLQAGLPRVDDAPVIFDLGSFTPPSFGIDATADEIDVTFEATDAWANEDDAAMLVYGSAPKNVSIDFFKGPYRLAGLVAGDSGTPPTSPAAITSPFAYAAGNKGFVQVRVTRADGRLSAPFRGSAVAA